METIQVRAAQSVDIPQLVELMTEFYAEAGYTLLPEPAARTFAYLLGDPKLGQVWILEYDSLAAGYIVLTVCFSMEYGGLRGFVDDLFVRESYRGRGLARAALEEVRRTCEVLGVRALHVEVGPENDAARGVYRRSGFKHSGRLLLTWPLAAPVHDA
jgi:ribosomal protein S18 acetylase RimI-like enzyme